MRGSKLIRLKQIVEAALTESSKNGFSLVAQQFEDDKKETQNIVFMSFLKILITHFMPGMKVYSTEEKELIMEPTLKWAGNPNILVAAKAFGLKATVHVVDLQVFASPRITLKPLIPSFPCFAKILVSLMEKPHVDFGLKLLGADAMSIQGLYSFVQTWNPIDNKKFETLSYLPPLTDDSIAREIDYMMKKGWIPCLEFDALGYVYRENSRIPNYYDGRYWTMWKLPMFGCTDASQVLHEIAECKKA
ncbi:hypothetical protein AgCh_027453 [Apium graveolens]